MGFGPGFVAMVQLLYAGAVSRVIVNGHCSGIIEQRGGVRQGCPLSPLLPCHVHGAFGGTAEKGACFSGTPYPWCRGTRAKVSVYADDMTLFLGRDEDFRAIGCPGGFTLCQDGLKILGVVFWRENSAQKNWDIALSKLKARAESWCKRKLSLTRRVVAACSDLLAGLNHLALVFPIPFVTGRSCPVAAQFWRRVSEWWSAEEGAGIDCELMLYGRGLKCMGPETANLLWQGVSVA
ncbi:hypothetical protein QTP70_016671, partial [Hemibagrus guttatus]